MSNTATPNPQHTPGEGLPDAGAMAYGSGSDDPTSTLDDDGLFDRVVLWYNEARDHFSDWRKEAITAYGFVSGEQWEESAKQTLMEQNRAPITFNRIAPFVDGVSGLEIGNRQDTQYVPRTLGASGVNELLTEAARWVRDECDAADEESEAVRDAIICGVGWTQTRMDYGSEPDGMIKVDRIDPLEVYPDPSSLQRNYDDARFVIHARDVPLSVARDLFPGRSIFDIHARWAEDSPATEPHNARIAPYYREDNGDHNDRDRQQVRLVEVEWWESKPAYRVIDPTSGKWVRLSQKDGITYADRVELLTGYRPELVKERERKYYKAIVGNVVLSSSDGPDKGGFRYKAITCKRDRNKGYWYGMVRAMLDPQMWANKFFSQALHIINTNAKGGILAETDAFVDIEEARDDWAAADSIIELNPGGVNKIMPKQPPQFPMQLNNMMQMAIDAIPSTAGVNLEMIAQQTNDQPGVLEMQRKQQGMAVLSYIFDAKRKYQRSQGRLMLWMIQSFIADGRLIRIGGAENARYVKLIHDPDMAQYDVIVDDAPSSPNMKERVWGMIMQMFPMLRQMPMPPTALLKLLEYSPFPASLVSELSKDIQQQSQQPPGPQVPPSQAALQQAQAQKAQADAQRSQAEAQRATVQAQLLPAQMQGEQQERQARVAHLNASAVNQLQNANISPSQHNMAVLDQGLGAHQQAHDQAMDRMSMLLNAHKAMQPPAPPGGVGA